MKRQNHIKFGVIGCGYWGPNFVRIIQQSNIVDLVAICDTNAEQLQTIASKYPSAVSTTNVDDILNDPAIEAVVIATPVKTHFELVAKALKAGKHVLCEKPLAYTVKECTILHHLADASGKVLLVGQVFEYNTVVRYMKQMIADKKIGEVLYLNLTRTGLGPVRADVNVTYDLASHDISIILALLETMPLAVTASGSCFIRKDIEDVAFVTMEFPNGILASINVSWIDPIKQRQVKVVGSKKMLLFEDVSVSEKLKIIDTGKDYQSYSGDFGSFQLSITDGDIIIPNIGYKEPLLEEFNHFVACIKKEQKPLTDATSATRVVKVLEAIQYSLKNNGIKVPM